MRFIHNAKHSSVRIALKFCYAFTIHIGSWKWRTSMRDSPQGLYAYTQTTSYTMGRLLTKSGDDLVFANFRRRLVHLI